MLSNGYLMSGSRDSTIKTWDIYKGVALKSLKIYSYWINILIKSPFHTNEIMSCSFDNHGMVRVWDAKNGKLIKELNGHSNSASCLLIIESGFYMGYFATGSFDKTIRLWTQVGKCCRILKGHTDWVYYTCFV